MSDFNTTRWTLVREASAQSAAGRQALSELCAACYEPVVAFLRHAGRDEDAAREVAHDFFARLLANPSLGGAEPGRGRFRNYLLGALKHHLSRRREHAQRAKRGGGEEIEALSLSGETAAGEEVRDGAAIPPDREFDRQWALHVLRCAADLLAAEWREAGRGAEYEMLQPFIAGEGAHGALADLAATRRESAATLRKTVSRLRERFRHHVKTQLLPTLPTSQELDDEMRALLGALSA